MRRVTGKKVIDAKDYHKILGVSKKASKEEIQKAFRRLALMYHPDRNKDAGAEERFKEINEAYAVLTGKEKAPQFDAGAISETWEASVVRRWDEMINEKHNNMYR
jgi:DnaJ-class molecular chaperone